jgi:hypothetical protein
MQPSMNAEETTAYLLSKRTNRIFHENPYPRKKQKTKQNRSQVSTPSSLSPAYSDL